MNNHILSVGPHGAANCFYLPTAPMLPHAWQYNGPDAIAQLIELNGNHWRKILVIMAKITAPDDWRDYMSRLLTQDNRIVFGATEIQSEAQRHFVCGQQSARNLDLPILDQNQTFKPIHHDKHLIYLLPYLDYRQCPNRTITDLRDELMM